MSIDMRMDGLEDLKRKLARLPDDVANKVSQPALLKAAEPVVQEAQRRAPKRTGAGAAAIEAASRRQGWNEFEVAVGPSVSTTASRREGFYLRFSELRIGPRVTKTGADRGRMKHQPFLRPALDARQREVIEIARRELWRGIEREAR